MSAKIEIYEDNAGEWRWRLIHENGNIMADSSEGYDTLYGAKHALQQVKNYMRFKETAVIIKEK